MLTVDTTAAYLVARGLLTTKAVLFEDLCVTTATRRNPNMIVTHRGESPGLLIKQVDCAVKGADLSIGIEGAFYRFAARGGKDELRSVMAAMIGLDEDNRRLLLALVPDAVTLWKHIRRFSPPHFPTDTLRDLGAALAILHGTLLTSQDARAFKGHLRSDSPWALRAHRPTPDLIATLSQANLEVLRIVQERPELSGALDGLAALWQPTVLIHGDIKAENILVAAEPAGADGPGAVKLIDWELVQIGDPAWDLAGVLQHIVLFWINTMSPAETVDEMVLSAVWPWAAIQPAFASLMQGYAGRRRLGAAAFNDLLLRTVRFCGARLVQTAFEMAQMSDAIPTPSALLLQLSSNVLADPHIAQMRLFRLVSRLESVA